jgi:hypothetical protein
MRDKMRVVVFAVCGSLALLPVEGAAPPWTQGAAGVVPCNVEAYVNDPDPRGTNVRSGPGSAFRVVGNLPSQNVEGVVVNISGSKGDWLRIVRAVEVGGAEEERTLFAGEGWVYGPLLGVNGVGWLEGGTPLYREPAKRGRVLTRVPADGEGPTVIRGCRGRWVYVEHRKVRGWAAPGTLCSNPLTTCS